MSAFLRDTALTRAVPSAESQQSPDKPAWGFFFFTLCMNKKNSYNFARGK